MNPVIYPIFSSPVIALSVEEDISLIKKEAKRQKFTSNDGEQFGAKNCFISNTHSFLDKFPKEKQILQAYFEFFKNEILRYTNTNFEMTTSWVTKAVEGSQSHYHRHRNSMFSGVLYLDNIENSGKLMFENENLNPCSFLLEPSDYNIYNSTTWEIQPKENIVVFFPSFLRHKIGIHLSKTPRYSIAFNFHPVGRIGYNDSSVDISLNPHEY